MATPQSVGTAGMTGSVNYKCCSNHVARYKNTM